MRIVFTGGGTGGHFYPIIAIAQELSELVRERKLLKPEMYFMSVDPYNEGLLFENNISFVKVSAGKRRRYFSILNFIDLFKITFGIFEAIWKLYRIYPDVVFGKGGFATFPVLFAARILRIPVIIHETDTVPGRANAWAGKFAKRIAVGYPDAAANFPEGKVAYTGNPVRKEIAAPDKKTAQDFFKLEASVPTILVLGGSQGSQIINNAVLDALPNLLPRYQIIHQVGEKNITEVQETLEVLLGNKELRSRYHVMPYLNTLEIRSAAGAADLIISRAGGTIAEIAAWGKPSIIIPITDTNGDHQRKNAFAYARIGACSVIEEKNLTSNILTAEIERIATDPILSEKMRTAAKEFHQPEAAKTIASEILNLALPHEFE